MSFIHRSLSFFRRIFFCNLTLPVLLIFQTALLIYLLRTKTLLTDEESKVILLSAISLCFSVLAINSLISLIANRYWRVSINVLLIVLYIGAGLYHAERGSYLDFSLIYTNANEIFKPGGFFFLLRTVGFLGFTVLGALLTSLFLLEKKFYAFSHAYGRGIALKILIFSVLGNGFILYAFDQDTNELNAFSRSIWRHFDSPYKLSELQEFQNTDLNYHPGPIPAQMSGDKPNIFFIFVESLNSTFLNQKTEKGEEITPFLNARIRDSFYVDNFFNNSVQTARGQVAALCSITPSFRHKIMTHYLQNRFRCLPEILKEVGYWNIFAKAHTDISFDRSGEFAKKVGYDDIYGMEGPYIQPGDEKYIWGWGLQDDIFFDKVLSQMDQRQREFSKDKKPFFVTLTTVSNHPMFDQIPKEIYVPYQEATNYRQHYINTLYLSDRYLEHFWSELQKRDYLKNSWIFIFGDNGYPLGEKGHYSNEIGFQDALFRTPLIILGVKSGRIQQTAYSQLDLAPTVLNWLNIHTATSFHGVPIQGDTQKTHYIPLVQPYDGRFLGSIRYPLKYVHQWSSGKEFVYNLREDRMEDDNLISRIDPNLLGKLRQDVKRIYGNQLLIESDLLFPKALTNLATHKR